MTSLWAACDRLCDMRNEGGTDWGKAYKWATGAHTGHHTGVTSDKQMFLGGNYRTPSQINSRVGLAASHEQTPI